MGASARADRGGRADAQDRAFRARWWASVRPELRGYPREMAQSAQDFSGDRAIALVNPEADTSLDAVAVWIAELEADDDWLELAVSAADLIAKDRDSRQS